MNSVHKEQEIRTNKVMDYQSDFINFVLDPNSTHGVILRGPAGMGKTETLSVLASRLMSENSATRVLILCPASHQQMWAEICKEKQNSVSVVDRYQYREMLDGSSQNNIWLMGMIYVMSVDFAKNIDITKSISQVSWDLVIGDEFSLSTGLRAKLFQNVRSISKRFVTSIPSWIDIQKTDLNHEMTLIDWDLNSAIQERNKKLTNVPLVSVHLTEFVLNSSEQCLEETVHEFCRRLAKVNYSQKLSADTMLDRLRSSPVALESALRKFLNMHDQKEPNFSSGLKDLDLSLSTERVELANSPSDRINANMIAKALGMIEDLQVDTKLQAVGTLMDSLIQKEGPQKHVFMVCAYLNTLHYLAAEFEGRSWQSSIIHGGIAFQECTENINHFVKNGGLLIASPAALQGVEINNVTDIVFYDFSFDEKVLYVILSRLNSINRTKPMNIHALVSPENKDCKGLDILKNYAIGERLL